MKNITLEEIQLADLKGYYEDLHEFSSYKLFYRYKQGSFIKISPGELGKISASDLLTYKFYKQTLTLKGVLEKE